jgi:hypothetical protein
MQLPSKDSNQSLNLKTDLSKNSLKNQNNINLKTDGSQSRMSLNTKVKQQIVDKSRNNPYNIDDRTSISTLAYLPLINGMSSVKHNSAYMNSYIGPNRSALSKHMSIRTPHIVRPEHYYGIFHSSKTLENLPANTSSLSSFTNERNQIAKSEFKRFRERSAQLEPEDKTDKGIVNNLLKSTQKELM